MDLFKSSDKIHRRILSKASHPYLVRFLNQPAVNETKLQLLVLMLNAAEVPIEEKEQYIIAVMLLQTALDIHDGVTETESDEDNDLLRNRQLTVLSGDYYSGLYYHILAQLSNIDLIKALAEGIKIINEEKIIVGQFKLADEYSILESFKKIESSLVAKIGKCLKIAGFTELFEEVLLVERLLKEKQQHDNGHYSLLYESLSHMHYRKDWSSLDIRERSALQEAIRFHIQRVYDNCLHMLADINPPYSELTTYFNSKLDKYETSFNLICGRRVKNANN